MGQPAVGSRPSLDATRNTSKGAVTKVGMQMPSTAKAITAKSVGLFCRSAARMPRNTPPIMAISIAVPPIIRLTGKPCWIICSTVLFFCFSDGPKSPCSTPPR